MINTNEMVLCINNGGVKFGEIRETDIEIWKSEVKEFVDLEGRVFIVSTNHINKPMAEGVDNIYTLRKLMATVWDEKDTKEMGCFTKTELHILIDVYNLGDIKKETLKNIEEHFSRMYMSNHGVENSLVAGEDE